ncbi:MAG: potassium/proton antiporter [Bacteroidales bacterium]
MILTTGNFLLIGSILLFISIVAGKTSYRFGVPILILFLGIGMLAGSEGLAGIYFNDPQTAQFIGIVALNFILFSGGLDTNWQTIRPVMWRGALLSSLGVLVTALTVGVFVWYITDFSLLEGLLLGAIVSSTDAAAVFSILRSRNLGLKDKLRPLLELESGSNDPMAYFLTIALTGLVVNQEATMVSIIPIFFMQVIIGGVLGMLFGRLGLWVTNKISLEYEGLYPVLMIAIMFFSFSFTDFLNGNGFLAVYITAVYLGNHTFMHKKGILKAFDGFAWLMQIILFLTLGLLVYPSQVISVMGIGIIISLFLILIARPVSVLLSLMFFRMKTKNRLFISWVGLRGAVPIVFATYPLLAGLDKAQMIFNIVFFISLTSIIIQGTSLPLVARWLKVTLPVKARPRTPLEIFLNDDEKSEFMEYELQENASVIGKKIFELHFPKNAIIALIKRNDKYVTPGGATSLRQGDRLVIISEDKQGLEQAMESLK